MTPDRRLRAVPLAIESLEDRTVPSTFWVRNTGDAGPGSLRQAVLDAAAHPGADVIRFRPAGAGTITLTSELLLTDELTVRGPGPARLTVSGGDATRVFDIAAGARVTIEDLTAAGGHVAGTDRGAGILNQGTLTLGSVVVRDNLSDSVGGGIENAGVLMLNRTRLVANRAATNGGGLHNARGGVATIDRSAVRDNTTVGDGAGIRSEVGATLTITHSTISGNAASGFGTGGIASGGALTVRDTRIDHNTSAVGGIYLFGFGSGGDVVISRSVIRDNGPNDTSGPGVGGIWSYSSGNIRIEDTVIRGNSGSRAGGVYGFGKMEIVGSTIDHNTGHFAGGMNVFGTLTLTRSKVSGNVGDTGGVNAYTATIVESTISGNSGTGVGGISCYQQLDLIRSTVNGNTAAPTEEGFSGLAVGGVEITSGRIENSTVSGNVVLADRMQPYYGPYGDARDATGGVFAQAGLGGATVAIENSTVGFNRVEGAPAGIRTSGGVAVARPSSFTYGGNTYESFTVVGVRNTIIGRNENVAGAPDVRGDVQSGGHDLIGVLTADATGFGASDQTGSPAGPLDPRLGPLAFNGGPTRTHALRPRSPAVDAGDNTDVPPTDQRGRQRIVHGVVDIGAYESRFPTGRGPAEGRGRLEGLAVVGTGVAGPAVAPEPPQAAGSVRDPGASDDRRDASPAVVGRQLARAVPAVVGHRPPDGLAVWTSTGPEAPAAGPDGVASIDGS